VTNDLTLPPPPAPAAARRARIHWLDGSSARTPRSAATGSAGLDSALDLTGRGPALALRHSDAVAGLPLTLRLGRGRGDCYCWTITSDGVDRPSMVTTGEPAEITLSFADAVVVGSPDRGAISWWELTVESDPAPQVDVDAIGWMAEPEEFPHGLISLTFDDSYVSQFDIAFPVMAAYGMPATLVPIIGRFDQPGCLTSAQVAAMAEAGWEIGAHALTEASHTQALHRMSPEARAAELEGIRAWNLSHGYAAATYSYPGGYYDAESAAQTLRYYSGTRSAYSEFRETWPPAQLDRIRSVVIKSDTHPDLDAYRAEISAARDHRAWVVLIFHRLAENAQGNLWEADAELFRAFCAELAGSDVPVLTMAQALIRPDR
jgi:peptidoglycan/xylan/chitin deacetylase (PgdA/CDA1 family)